MTTREETAADIFSIHSVNVAAFKRPQEADLIDALRARGNLAISLLAEIAGKIVGHIAFTGATTEPVLKNERVLGLGPLAVLPDQQRNGIGAALVKDGLEHAKLGQIRTRREGSKPEKHESY